MPPPPEASPAPEPVPTAVGPTFTLGGPQVRLLLAFAAVVALATGAVDAARFTFVTPAENPRATLDLLAYRTLPQAPEVLLLGSSRVDFGFDARLVQAALEEELGRPVPVYKCAQRGMRAWLLRTVLRDYVAPAPPTRLLVVGIDVQLFEAFDTSRALRQAGRLRDVPAALRHELSPRQWRELLALPFRGLQILANVPWLLRPDVRDAVAHQHAHSGEFDAATELRLQELEQLGFLRLRAVGLERPEPRTMRHRFEGGWFDEALEELRRLPCDVLLVRTAVDERFVQRIDAARWEAYFERVAAICADNGFGFVDLNEPPFKQREDDVTGLVHLTPAARDRVSADFAREVLAPLLAER